MKECWNSSGQPHPIHERILRILSIGKQCKSKEENILWYYGDKYSGKHAFVLRKIALHKNYTNYEVRAGIEEPSLIVIKLLV